MFDHNFSMRSAGLGRLRAGQRLRRRRRIRAGRAPASGSAGRTTIIRNNVAANGDVFGFALPARARHGAHPAFKGADTSKRRESVQFDTTDAPVLEFANNEAYGAIQTGVAWVWNGTISNLTVWHPSHHGFRHPDRQLIVDKLTVRGDLRSSPIRRKPVGIWLANYISRSVVIGQAPTCRACGSAS